MRTPRDLHTGPVIGNAFNPKRNGLNLVRLVLATSVIFHHSFPLLGLPEAPRYFGDQMGGWAVVGFFCLSGYLITASRWGKDFGSYLSLRIARIFPAFLLCLVVTVALFAPLNYLHVHGSLDGFFSTPTTPFAYVFVNSLLRMNAYDVAGTPLGVPYTGAWDGSLWSLYYEFLCYLIVGILGLFTIFRRSATPLLCAWALSVVLRMSVPRFAPYYGAGIGDLELLSKLLPYFLAGGVLFTVRKRIGMHWGLAAISVVTATAALNMSEYWGGQLASVPIAYLLMWIGSLLPSPELIRVHDVSYGMYIYGFLVQQLIVTYTGPAIGYWRFSLLAVLVTLVFAIASWVMLERPVMMSVRRSAVLRGQATSSSLAAPRPEFRTDDASGPDQASGTAS